MGRVKIPYYVVKKGRGYWQPTTAMKEQGFSSIRCGPDGPAAWARAEQINRQWQLHRHGLNTSGAKLWPTGSIGEAFSRFKNSSEWARMKPRTREDWERGQRLIEDIFGDLRPATISFEQLDEFYAALLRAKGLNEAYRAIKHWRRLWVKMAAMGCCSKDADPSQAIRRKSPSPRSQVWREGEVARLVKSAIRSGYPGLACIIAVAWGTQFSPVDVRSLKRSNLTTYKGRVVFAAVNREKTGRAILGTINHRTERLMRTYLQPAEDPSSDEFLFRNRSGNPYSKDTLGDDFRTVREKAFPGDKRVLMDIRRSGAVEAAAGDVDPNALAAKMGNTINRSQELQRTYQPVDLASVLNADEARREGRRRIRDAG